VNGADWIKAWSLCYSSFEEFKLLLSERIVTRRPEATYCVMANRLWLRPRSIYCMSHNLRQGSYAFALVCSFVRLSGSTPCGFGVI